jgi:hypothetical protein
MALNPKVSLEFADEHGQHHDGRGESDRREGVTRDHRTKNRTLRGRSFETKKPEPPIHRTDDARGGCWQDRAAGAQESAGAVSVSSQEAKMKRSGIGDDAAAPSARLAPWSRRLVASAGRRDLSLRVVGF